MIWQRNYGAHSAQVEMRLLIQGDSITITQMGPDFLFVESPAKHPPCDATIVLQIGQSERRWQVKLPEGISQGSTRVPLGLA
jgi:hypothetical protein